MAEVIAGITIPDSKMAQDATELVRDVADDLIYHHSRRVFLFASLLGQAQQLDYDPELVYIGAMFHDLGLTDKYRTTDQRFEIDAANVARDFLAEYDITGDAGQKVWHAIAVHTTPEIPLHMDPEVALVTRGVELDVLGIGFHAITDEQRQAVVEAHPRPGFKNRILAAFTNGLKDRPETTFGNVKADVLDHFMPGFQRGDFVEVIRSNPWSE